MFFDSEIKARIRKEESDKIQEIIKKHPNKFYDISHLVRCAIIQLHKKEVEQIEQKQDT